MAFLAIPAVASALGGGATGTALAAALSGSALGAAGAKATGRDWKKGALMGAAGAGLGALGAAGGAGASAAGSAPAGAGASTAAAGGASAGIVAPAASAAPAASSGSFSSLLADTGKDAAKQVATQEAVRATQTPVETTQYGPPLQWMNAPQLQWGPMLA